MAKSNNPKPKKPIVLNEVSITATRLGKRPTSTPFKSGGLVKSVENKTVDSIRRANPALGRAIGQPVGKAGQVKKYGDAQKDLILQAIKPKKKK